MTSPRRQTSGDVRREGKESIGIFGGTFDPPHLGHLILAGEALAQLGLGRVLWVLTPDPPHKLGRQITGVEIRASLIQAAIEGEPAFELSRVDVDRPGPHYAVDTVQILRRSYPQAELVYLMGADSLHDLPGWHQPQAFVDRCDRLGVMCRPGEQVDMGDLEASIPGIAAKTIFVDAPLLEIASSEIRARIRTGGHYRFYLPAQVYALIRERGYYR